MEAIVLYGASDADVVVMAAAVADFRPKVAAESKLRKADGPPEIVLEPTTDILAELGRRKRSGQVLVGFAAETGDVRAAAEEKLRSKRLDLIVANDITAPGAGFGHDTNAATVLDAAGNSTEVAVTTKRALASLVLDLVADLRGAVGGAPPRAQGLGADTEGGT